MPRRVIDIDALNNLNAKIGSLTIPMKKVKGAVKTARKTGRIAVNTTTKKAKKTIRKKKR